MTLVWHELQFSQQLASESVLRFTRSLTVRAKRGLLKLADPVVVEVRGSARSLSWRLGVTVRDQAQVIGALRLALPDTHLTPVDYEVPVGSVGELRLSSRHRLLRTDVSDQLASALLTAVQRAGREESVCLQWLVGPWLHRPPVPPVQTQRQPRSILDVGRVVLDSEQAKVLRDKQAEPVFGVVGRIVVHAATAQRRKQLRQGVLGALQVLQAPGVGFRRRRLPSVLLRYRLTHLQRPIIGWGIVLNAAELAACLGWPIGAPPLPGINYSTHRYLPAAPEQLVREGTTVPKQLRVTGRSTYPGRSGLLTLSIEDALHGLHVIGPTGTGKSNLIGGIALRDMEAGRGVVVIDPKRDLVEAIADRIPAERLNDVVLLDPADQAPVGYNVLRAQEPDLAVDTVLHILRELYANSWGPRTADVLHNGLLTLTRHGGMTLCELVPLLTHTEFRRQVVTKLRDDVLGVAPFWHWFESLSPPERATVIAPALNKLRAFTGRPAIRGVIGQVEGFDLTEVFTKRRVLLVSLARGSVGSESAQLFGALLLGGLWATMQQRSQIAPEKRHRVVVYIDEFAEVLRLPIDLGDALAQVRGLGVGLVLAHQELRGQLTPAMRAAVLANARSRIVFQCGHDDATALAKVLGNGLTAQDIQNLPVYETYQSLSLNGRTSSPASAATLPLPEALGTLDQVRESSRQRNGVTRAETDRALRQRLDNTPPRSDRVGTKPSRRQT